jgi:hypothetical protein
MRGPFGAAVVALCAGGSTPAAQRSRRAPTSRFPTPTAPFRAGRVVGEGVDVRETVNCRRQSAPSATSWRACSSSAELTRSACQPADSATGSASRAGSSSRTGRHRSAQSVSCCWAAFTRARPLEIRAGRPMESETTAAFSWRRERMRLLRPPIRTRCAGCNSGGK